MSVKKNLDVLCVGRAAHDIMMYTDHHPGPDEKCFASGMVSCAGGNALNAAVTASRLGFQAGFCGLISRDPFGEKQARLLEQEQVDLSLSIRGDAPTPLSVCLVKPGGLRTIVNFRDATPALPRGSFDFSLCTPSAVLFDGHEPDISKDMAHQAAALGIPAVLDGGSVHTGTVSLLEHVQYAVVSEKFLHGFTGEEDEQKAFNALAGCAPVVIVTLGKRGLLWKNGSETGSLPAFKVEALDTSGAGDAFHGAFTAGLAAGIPWPRLLEYASAAGALCSMKKGTVDSMPYLKELDAFLRSSSSSSSDAIPSS